MLTVAKDLRDLNERRGSAELFLVERVKGMLRGWREKHLRGAPGSRRMAARKQGNVVGLWVVDDSAALTKKERKSGGERGAAASLYCWAAQHSCQAPAQVPVGRTTSRVRVLPGYSLVGDSWVWCIAPNFRYAGVHASRHLDKIKFR